MQESDSPVRVGGRCREAAGRRIGGRPRGRVGGGTAGVAGRKENLSTFGCHTIESSWVANRSRLVTRIVRHGTYQAVVFVLGDRSRGTVMMEGRP
jgi:hypothetical protein